MLEAVKGNKVYSIEEPQADAYAADGYDILRAGKIVKHALNKTVPFTQYEKALAEIDRLKKQLAAAKKAEK